MTSGIGVGLFMMCGNAPQTDDVWFSYLPLAHIFERVAHITFMSYGCRWAYSGGTYHTFQLLDIQLILTVVKSSVEFWLKIWIIQNSEKKLDLLGKIETESEFLIKKGNFRKSIVDQNFDF